MKNGVKASRRGTIERTSCARCQGFLVPGFTESQMLESTEHPSAKALRCVNCGEWVDATVTANRMRAHGQAVSSGNCLLPFSRRRWRW